MNAIARIMAAANAAAQWHAAQKRKGEAAEPYINHLLEVAGLVAEATDGEPDLVIAALLHDAMEDQQIERETISEMFGPTVADLVVELTDDKSLPKEVRKELQVKNAPHKSNGASVIKLADKTSNLRAIAEEPAGLAQEAKIGLYRVGSRGCRRPALQTAGLLAEFEAAATAATASVRP